MSQHLIPFGTGEKMQYLVHAFNDNTVRFVLHYPSPLDAGALRRAALALAQSIDVLHASMLEKGSRFFWQVNEAFSDSDCFSFLYTDTPLAAALDDAVQPVSPHDRAQMHCFLAQNDVESALCVRISHLCADGSDSLYLLKKLCEACQMQLTQGHCRNLQVKNGSRSPEQVYENLSFRQRLSLWRNPMTGVHSSFPLDDKAGKKCIITHTLPADLMKKAHDLAKSQNASVNDVILAACYRALAGLPGNSPLKDMSIMSMMDLRRHCTDGDSRGLCNLSGSLPTVLHGVTGHFSCTLREVARQTKALKADPLCGLKGMPILHTFLRRLPFRSLLIAGRRVYGGMSVGLTNMGNIACEALKIGQSVPDGGCFGGPLKIKPAVQVSCMSFDSSCSLSMLGEYSANDARTAKDFLLSIEREITLFIENAR